MKSDIEQIIDQMPDDEVAPQPYKKPAFDIDSIIDQIPDDVVANDSPTPISSGDIYEDTMNMLAHKTPVDMLADSRGSADKFSYDNPMLLEERASTEADIKNRYRGLFPLTDRPNQIGKKYTDPPLPFMAKAVQLSALGIEFRDAVEYEAKAQGYLDGKDYMDELGWTEGFLYRQNRGVAQVFSGIGHLMATVTAGTTASLNRISNWDIGAGQFKDLDATLKREFGEDAVLNIKRDFASINQYVQDTGIEIAQEMSKVSEEVSVKDPSVLENMISAGTSQVAFSMFGLGIMRAMAATGVTTEVARTTGTAWMTIFEAGSEKGGVVLDAIQNGKSIEEANVRGDIAFVLNLPLDYTLNKMGLSIEKGSLLWDWVKKGSPIARVAKGAAATGTIGGVEEVAQLAISTPLGQDRMPTFKEMVTEFAYAFPGASMSGIAQAVSKKTGASDALKLIAEGKRAEVVEDIAQRSGVDPKEVQRIAKERPKNEAEAKIYGEILQAAIGKKDEIEQEVDITDEEIDQIASGKVTAEDVMRGKVEQTTEEAPQTIETVDTAELEAQVATGIQEREVARQDILATAKGIVDLKEVEPFDMVVEGKVDIRGTESAFEATLKDGRKVTFLIGGKQTPVNKEALAKYGLTPEEAEKRGVELPGQNIPLPEGAIISLAKIQDSTIRQEKMRHEWYHAVENMFFTDAEKKILDDRYFKPEVDKDASEQRAAAYEKWDGKTATPHGLFEKFRDFITKLYNFMKYRKFTSATSIFADIESGKILEYERAAKAKGVAYSLYSIDKGFVKRDFNLQEGDKKYRELLNKMIPFKISEILNNVVTASEATKADLNSLIQKTGRKIDKAIAVKFKYGLADKQVNVYIALGDTGGLGSVYDHKNDVIIINKDFGINDSRFDASVRRGFYRMLEDRGYISPEDIQAMNKEIEGAVKIGVPGLIKEMLAGGMNQNARADFFATVWPNINNPDSIWMRIDNFLTTVLNTLNSPFQITGRIMRDIESGNIFFRNIDKVVIRDGRVSYSLDVNDQFDEHVKRVIDEDTEITKADIATLKWLSRATIDGLIQSESPNLPGDIKQAVDDARRRVRGNRTINKVVRDLSDLDLAGAMYETEEALRKEYELGKKIGESEGKAEGAEQAKSAKVKELKALHSERLTSLKKFMKAQMKEKLRRDRESKVKNKLRADIFKMLKNSQPTVKNGIRKGKYTADAQLVIDGVYRAYKESQNIRAEALGEWRARYSEILKGLKDKNDERSKAVKSRINAHLDVMISNKTQILLAEKQIELDKLNNEGADILKAAGKQVEMGLLQGLQGRTVKDLDMDKLKSIKSDMQALIETGKLLGMSKHILEGRKIQDKKDRVLADLRGESRNTPDDIRNMQDKENWLGSRLYGKWIRSWSGLVRELSVYSESSTRDSALSEIGNINEANNKKMALQMMGNLKLQTALEKSYGLKGWALERFINKGNKKMEFDSGVTDFEGNQKKYRLTHWEVLGIYAKMLDPKHDATLFTAENGNKLRAEFVEEIKKNITEQDVAFLKEVRDIYDWTHKIVNEKYRELSGIDLPYNPNYTPVTRDIDKQNIELNPDGTAKFDISGKRMNPAFVHTKSDSTAKFKFNSLLSEISSHIEGTTYYNAFAEKTQELNQIFYDKDIAETIKKRFGTDTYRQLTQHLETFMSPGGRIKNFIGSVKELDHIRSMFSRSVLAGKAKLFFTNMTAFAGYADDMPLNKFVANMTANPAELQRFHKFLLENSTYYKWRIGSFTEHDVNEIMRSSEYERFFISPTWTNTMMLNIKWGDKVAILLGGYSHYKYNYERFIEKGMSEEDAQNKAISEFEKVSQLTQQSSGVDQLTLAQKSGSSYARLFYMFISQPRQYIELEFNAINEIAHGKDVVKNARRVALYHIILPMMFQAMGNVMTRGVDWEDEEMYRLLQSAVLGNLNSIIMLGNSIETLAQMAIQKTMDVDMGRKFGSTNRDLAIYGIADEIYKAFEAMTSEDKDSNEAFWEAVRHGSNAAGYVKGLPIKTLIDMYEGFEAITEGDIKKAVPVIMGVSPKSIEKRREREE